MRLGGSRPTIGRCPAPRSRQRLPAVRITIRPSGSEPSSKVGSRRRSWRSSSVACITGRPSPRRSTRRSSSCSMRRWRRSGSCSRGRSVLVEDGPAEAPNLRIAGALSDLTSLMATPLVRGVPSPMRARGRAALGLVAGGRVRVTGRMGLMRRFLQLIRGASWPGDAEPGYASGRGAEAPDELDEEPHAVSGGALADVSTAGGRRRRCRRCRGGPTASCRRSGAGTRRP